VFLPLSSASVVGVPGAGVRAAVVVVVIVEYLVMYFSKRGRSCEWV